MSQAVQSNIGELGRRLDQSEHEKTDAAQCVATGDTWRADLRMEVKSRNTGSARIHLLWTVNDMKFCPIRLHNVNKQTNHRQTC